jgi:L-fuculose-phosphate aldolase
MYNREFVAANDGNISVRISDDEIWTTPTGVSKGFMTPDMLVQVDLAGNVVSGTLQPSSEIKMHLRVYKERPDMFSVCHAHPITATAFAVTGIPMDKPFMAESVVIVGEVPIAPYATTGTDAVAESVAPYLKDHNAVLLANHGALTYGRTLTEAFYRMEALENAAKIYLAVKQLGTPRLISGADLDALAAIRDSLGFTGALPRNIDTRL